MNKRDMKAALKEFIIGEIMLNYQLQQRFKKMWKISTPTANRRFDRVMSEIYRETLVEEK
jgi:hypothetical protein